VDESTVVSIKNGGGIRAAIGEVVQVSDDVYEFLPPQANPLSGKMEGEISQLDIENSMRFNNALSLLTLTAEGLKAVLEHGVAAWTPGATPGQFAQVGGVRFSFDPSLAAGSRVRSAVIIDEQDMQTDILVEDGNVVGDPEREFRVVTLSFLATGGDSYPFPAFASDIVNLQGSVPQEVIDAGVADFTAAGTEQDAFAEYAAEFFSNSPFNVEDTPASEDTRIQNLSLRSDEVIQPEPCPGSEILAFTQGLQTNGQPVAADRSNQEAAVGMPDASNAPGGFVSLGVGGSITIGFSGAVNDGPGNDIMIYETSFSGDDCGFGDDETANIEVSQDGMAFVSVGTICRDGGVDIAGAGLEYVSAVRITNSDVTGTLDGYDVDGVVAFYGCGLIPEIETGECAATEVVEYVQGIRSNGGALPVNRTDFNQATGEPEGTDALVFVTLGYNGSITLAFDGAVPNEDGPDLEVVETSFNTVGCEAYSEYADVLVSQDGENFFFAKTVCKADNLVDIEDAGQDWDHVNFVKVENNNTLTTTPDAYDLDGVRALHNCVTEDDDQDDDTPSVVLVTEAVNVLGSQPNPTSGQSTVFFKTTSISYATLEVFDMNGRSIATLFNQVANEGQNYQFDFDGNYLANGVYIYRLTTENDVVIEKFMIAR
jgi:hypothetical protein